MSTHLRIAATVAPLFAAGSARAAGSMPQMDPTWYPNQLFWLAVSFVVLYLAVSRFIAPTVGGVLKTREHAINDAIAKAEELKAAANSTQGTAQAAGADARAKAASTLAEAQAAAAKASADAQAKLAGELETKGAAAKKAIASALEKASANLDEAASDLAQAMSEKLLAGKVAAADVKSAVAQAKKA